MLARYLFTGLQFLLLALLFACESKPNAKGAENSGGGNPPFVGPSEEIPCLKAEDNLPKETFSNFEDQSEVLEEGHFKEFPEQNCRQFQDYFSKLSHPYEWIPNSVVENTAPTLYTPIVTEFDGSTIKVTPFRIRHLKLKKTTSQCGKTDKEEFFTCSYVSIFRVMDYAIAIAIPPALTFQVNLTPGNSTYVGGVHFYQALPYGSDSSDSEINDRLYLNWSFQSFRRDTAIAKYLREKLRLPILESGLNIKYLSASGNIPKDENQILAIQLGLNEKLELNSSHWSVRNQLVDRKSSSVHFLLDPYLSDSELSGINSKNEPSANILFSGQLVFDATTGKNISCSIFWPDSTSCQRLLTESFSKVFKTAILSKKPLFVRLLWQPTARFGGTVLTTVKVNTSTGAIESIASIDAELLPLNLQLH